MDIESDKINRNDDRNRKSMNLRITDDISKINITKIVIFRSIIAFTVGDKLIHAVSFNPDKTTISNLIKDIKKKLYRKLESFIDDNKTFESAIWDIEDQIVEHRDEIFKASLIVPKSVDGYSHEIDDFKANFAEDVIALRKKWMESPIAYEEWQSKVSVKYENLKQTIEKHYPEAWIFMEFCLSVKSIINIQDFTLPFMGVLIAAPSSMKTMVIQLFRKYPHTFYTDSFTPSSLVSHNSAKTEEELQKVDMLPKLKNKLVLTPELAPIITAKEDDLQKVMGIITRLLHGHGLENDSGAHGHRKYGDTMFVWLGAAVEIPPRVWKLLGTLGHKIYFLRPALRKKSINDLVKIAKSNNFSSINKELEDALLDYLRTFDAAPDIDGKIKLESGIVKVKWNEENKGEQDISIGYIAQLANLLAPLRGTVYVSESRFSNRKNYSNAPNQQQQIEGQDYDTDFPTIEDPSRAVVLLRNIAIGHAISQGRDRINLKDIPIVIKVALSTAPVRRVKVLDLLLKSDNGELSTSQITRPLSISQPIATRTMREFNALGIVDISAIGNYENSELKITLRPEFEWFRSQEFLNLKEGFVPIDDNYDELEPIDRHIEKIVDDANTNSFTSPVPNQDTINSNGNNQMESCDNSFCHTLKQNLPPEAHENNNSCHNKKETEQLKIDDDKTLSNIFNSQVRQQPQNNTNISIPQKNIRKDEFNNIITTTTESFNEKGNASPLPKSYERVTASHEKNCHTSSETPLIFKENNDEGDNTFNSIFQEILNIIKFANGSSISFNSVIGSANENSEAFRNYLGDKLTARENRLVRDIQLKTIRHTNVEVIKYKPQLLIRWIDSSLEQ